MATSWPVVLGGLSFPKLRALSGATLGPSVHREELFLSNYKSYAPRVDTSILRAVRDYWYLVPYLWYISGYGLCLCRSEFESDRFLCDMSESDFVHVCDHFKFRIHLILSA